MSSNNKLSNNISPKHRLLTNPNRNNIMTENKLSMAIENRDLTTIKQLIKEGYKVNINMLKLAESMESMNIFDYLLNLYDDIQFAESLLIQAISHKNKFAIKLLINKGIIITPKAYELAKKMKIDNFFIIK